MAFASPNGGPLGDFEAHGDVGSPKIAGYATYNGVSQTYTLSAGGVNIWAQRDEFQFAYRKMKGDFIVQAQVEFVGTGTDPHRKTGIMARSSLDFDATYVDGAKHGDGLIAMQYRKAKGGDTEQTQMPDAKGADYIELERVGNTFIWSAARFGEPYQVVKQENVDLPEELYVGLFLSAHNVDVKESSVFHNVRVIKPVKVGFTPYRDYIGSRLEVLSVGNGHRSQIYSSRVPFEAPNWAPDGGSLFYQSSGGDNATRGRLYKFDLATRLPQQIDTGYAIRLNNDHVLSFDGKQMGISHHSADDNNASIIYTLPTGGGVPKRITAKGPSYFHGWSPDAKWLVYAGQRDNDIDVYRISANGGEEQRLTNTPGVDDGPEYTPDGKYIYFNSSRTGRMQLWRMKPDGSAQEQVTNDGFNNWFAHISPDGQWIAYIAFPPEVPANDHPFYKHVLLRLMPIKGGPARVIAYLYGGQGTINVPSWSPDGKFIAFVSNTDSY